MQVCTNVVYNCADTLSRCFKILICDQYNGGQERKVEQRWQDKQTRQGLRSCCQVGKYREIVSDTLLKHILLNGRRAIKIGVNQDKLNKMRVYGLKLFFRSTLIQLSTSLLK